MNKEYKTLVREILDNGIATECRNGLQRIIPHYCMIIQDMENNHKLTLRKMYYKGIEGEFKTLIQPFPVTNVGQVLMVS